jgi:hypothetical protein
MSSINMQAAHRSPRNELAAAEPLQLLAAAFEKIASGTIAMLASTVLRQILRGISVGVFKAGSRVISEQSSGSHTCQTACPDHVH